jgi:hypothetical protein
MPTSRRRVSGKRRYGNGLRSGERPEVAPENAGLPWHCGGGKSTIRPCLSTARNSHFHSPFTRMQRLVDPPGAAGVALVPPDLVLQLWSVALNPPPACGSDCGLRHLPQPCRPPMQQSRPQKNDTPRRGVIPFQLWLEFASRRSRSNPSLMLDMFLRPRSDLAAAADWAGLRMWLTSCDLI